MCRTLREQTGVQCSARLRAAQCLHNVFMGAAFTEHLTDGISNQRQILFHSLLKVATLLFSTFI